ncbi:hypothetical protein ASE66_24895 [Bosea sp. Root483D1]|nr:hypothetical protein ASE66_24895 [Bosea sp. Root483D1]
MGHIAILLCSNLDKRKQLAPDLFASDSRETSEQPHTFGCVRKIKRRSTTIVSTKFIFNFFKEQTDANTKRIRNLAQPA